MFESVLPFAFVSSLSKKYVKLKSSAGSAYDADMCIDGIRFAADCGWCVDTSVSFILVCTLSFPLLVKYHISYVPLFILNTAVVFDAPPA